MKYKSIYATILVSLFILSMIMLPLHVYATATVWTDKPDYGPEETVTIYGSGFLANVQVTITITAPNSSVATIYADSDDSGAFTAQYKLNGMVGTYTVTATDGTNSATTTFTDRTWSVSVSPTSATVPQGGSTTATVTVSADPTGGPQVDLWATGQPPGVTVSFSPTAGTPYFTSTMSISVGPATVPGTYPIDIIVFTGKPGQPSYSEKARTTFTLTVTGIPPATVSITITSSPVTGSGFVKVDDTPITTPTTFVWTIGSTHKLEALSPVSGGIGTQYVYTDWSDAGGQTHWYTVPGASATVTANYKTQYLLTIKTKDLPSSYSTSVYLGGSAVGTASESSPFTKWFDNGDPTGTIGVDGTISGTPGTQYVFEEWDEDSSTSNPRASEIMNGPKTFTAEYKTQYLVSFTQTGSAVAPTVTYTANTDPLVPCSVWVLAGSQISYTYQSIVPGAPGVQYVLTGVTPTSPQTVNGPLTILGTYKTQYYLTVLTFPEGLQPTPTPQSGWYDECTHVTLTAPSTAHIGNIVYTFGCWQINGKLGWAGENPITIHMDSPKIACARYCELGDPIGDVNLDGKVDMIDIATIARHYGAKLGEPNYNVACDLNLDGKIDIRDLAAAAINFSY